MVNFHDPNVIFAVSQANGTLSSVACGLYIWEFLTHLDYEWSVVKGHRPYRWTIWIYSTVRFATFIAVIIYLLVVTITTPINCKAWIISLFAFAYMSFSFSSLLIVLRIIAIWNKNTFVLVLAVGTWLTNVSVLIEGATQIRSEWVPRHFTCRLPNVESNKLAFTALLVTDVVLLFTMFIGLLRLRHRGGGKFALGHLLWKQGVIYLLVATIAEIMPVVFLFLDFNISFDLLFLIPALIALSIAATRIHRSLTDFGFSINIGQCLDNPQRVDRPVSNAGWSTIIPLPQNQVEVAVHTSYEHWQSPEPQTGHYTLSDGQLDDDVESCAEK